MWCAAPIAERVPASLGCNSTGVLTVYIDMSPVFAPLLARLLSALQSARHALKTDAAEAAREALDEAFAVLGALYAALDSKCHPELSRHLQSAYDQCLQLIGEARPENCEGLTSAITLMRHIQSAEEATRHSGWPDESLSTISRSLGGR